MEIKNNLGELKWYQWVGIIAGLVIFYSIMSAIYVGGNSSSNSPTSFSGSFASDARAHFDSILTVSPELSAINCEDDCSSVIYFDYKKVPDDLAFVIRGNAATFSKFKLDKTGVSNVTIVARHNGNVLMSCDAGQGQVKSCQ